MRVLILEDEPILQMDLAMMLEGRGYRVSTSETAEGAVEVARLEQPSVAILDLNLGHGRPDGVDAAREIMRVSPSTQIIFQTAHQDPKSRGRMISVMPVAILNKPFDEARLLALVAGAEGVAA